MSRLREQHFSLAMRSEVRACPGKSFSFSRLLTSMLKVSSQFVTQEMRIRKDASKTLASFEAELQEELAGMIQSLREEKNEKMRAAAAFQRHGSLVTFFLSFSCVI